MHPRFTRTSRAARIAGSHVLYGGAKDGRTWEQPKKARPPRSRASEPSRDSRGSGTIGGHLVRAETLVQPLPPWLVRGGLMYLGRAGPPSSRPSAWTPDKQSWFQNALGFWKPSLFLSSEPWLHRQEGFHGNREPTCTSLPSLSAWDISQGPWRLVLLSTHASQREDPLHTLWLIPAGRKLHAGPDASPRLSVMWSLIITSVVMVICHQNLQITFAHQINLIKTHKWSRNHLDVYPSESSLKCSQNEAG
jgi:hypothetical protein